MSIDRWEGNIRYCDYTPETIRPHADRHVSTVAEGYLHADHNPKITYGILAVVSEQNLAVESFDLDAAIKRARMVVRKMLADEKRDRETGSRTITDSETNLVWWHGGYIDKVPPAR